MKNADNRVDRLCTDGLERVTDRLAQCWEAYRADPSNEFARETLVLRFGLAFEVSHKLLRRFLVLSSVSDEARLMTFPELIKHADDRNLLYSGLASWERYREMSGSSRSACAEDAAPEVAVLIPGFLSEAERLRERISGTPVMYEARTQLDITPAQLEIVRSCLRRHVPDRTVLAYGSRAKGKARKHSDLDMAIMGDEPLDFGIVMDLDEDLSWSDLPFNVDIVVWADTAEGYRRDAIRDFGIPVQEPDGGQQQPGLK